MKGIAKILDAEYIWHFLSPFCAPELCAGIFFCEESILSARGACHHSCLVIPIPAHPVYSNQSFQFKQMEW
jgi:hypothetical protein